MPNINIQVAAKIATNLSPGTPIVCGNSDYTVTFTFDEEWAAHPLKTARFVYTKDGQVHYVEAAFSGNVAAVPVLSGITAVYVGVYAGDLRTTTPAKINCDRSILCGTGLEHEEPDPDVYNQILEEVNRLIGLTGDHPARTDNPHGVTAAQVGAAPASHATDKNNPHGVTAAQVGAAPASHATDKNNPHVVTAAQVGAATPAQVNAAVKKAAPHNLLDNSDFRNPVNQRGQTSYNATDIYSIDRWFSPAPNTITVNADSINVSDNYFVQRVEAKKLTGSKYTVGFMVKTGLLMGCVDISNVEVGEDRIAYANGAHAIRLYRESENIWQCYILCGLSTDFLYAFIYEGEYTAETLPEYQPKGYAHELAECQRYYYKLNRECIGNGYATSTGNSAIMHLPFTMRIPNPTIVYTDFVCRANGTDYVCDTVCSANADNMLYLACTSPGIPVKYAASFYSNHPIALSADL